MKSTLVVQLESGKKVRVTQRGVEAHYKQCKLTGEDLVWCTENELMFEVLMAVGAMAGPDHLHGEDAHIRTRREHARALVAWANSWRRD